MARTRVMFLFAACLLQLTFITAKPDFGVDVMIRGSGAVQGTAVLIEQQFIELTGHMSFSLVSSYGLLSELRTQMDLLARNVSSIGTAFATALNIASTSSSNVSATFEPVVLALSSLQTLQVDHLPAILAEIQSLVELPIKLELQDSFRAIFSTVQLLAGAVLQLTSAVVNSNDPANVDVSAVNMVNRAASVLRANIVPLNYTIASTGDNIRAVDAFLARLSSSVQSNTVTVGNDFERFLQQQYQLKNTTIAGLSCTKQEISDIGSSVAPFLPILCDGSDPCDLQTTVEQIMQLQSDEVDQVATTMTRQIDELARFKPVYTAAASELFNRTYNLGLFLADVTVIKGPYALHCFKKYSNLVEQLIPRVTDGFNVCYRQETTRLRSLRTSLLNMYVTFGYDFEDLFDYLQLCVKSVSGESDCGFTVNNIFTLLGANMRGKLNQMKAYLEAEIDSSSYRLLMCVLETNVTVVHDYVQLKNDIEQCRQNGSPSQVPVVRV